MYRTEREGKDPQVHKGILCKEFGETGRAL